MCHIDLSECELFLMWQLHFYWRWWYRTPYHWLNNTNFRSSRHCKRWPGKSAQTSLHLPRRQVSEQFVYIPDNFFPFSSSFFVFHDSIYMIAFSEPHKSLFPPDESPGAAAKWFPFYSLQIFCQKLETQPIWCLSNKSDKPQYGIIHHTNYEWNLFSISKVELLV